MQRADYQENSKLIKTEVTLIMRIDVFGKYNKELFNTMIIPNWSSIKIRINGLM